MGNKPAKNGKKVLVVDDEHAVRLALNDKLEAAGFEVILANNGIEGLKMAFVNHPDLIVLDILMPKMDGIETLKMLREDSWGKNVPVIILTNISDYYQLEEALKIGISEYMVKAEWSLKDVVERVKAVLNI
jgi:two-component system, OmpR family, alkaline phosphatase synthesis response regulator PhoP